MIEFFFNCFYFIVFIKTYVVCSQSKRIQSAWIGHHGLLTTNITTLHISQMKTMSYGSNGLRYTIDPGQIDSGMDQDESLTREQKCLTDNTVCNIGTYDFLFNFGRYSSMQPHVVDFNWDNINESPNETLIKLASFVNESVIGVPMVSLNKSVDVKRLINLEPFIPFCTMVTPLDSQYPFLRTLKDSDVYNLPFCEIFQPSEVYYFLFRPTVT